MYICVCSYVHSLLAPEASNEFASKVGRSTDSQMQQVLREHLGKAAVILQFPSQRNLIRGQRTCQEGNKRWAIAASPGASAAKPLLVWTPAPLRHTASHEPHGHGKSVPTFGNQGSPSDAGKVQESHVKAWHANRITDVYLPSLSIFWSLLPCFMCNWGRKGGAADQIWPISSAKSIVPPLMALYAR